MSAESLATAIIDSADEIVRNQIDDLRVNLGNADPLTDDQWNDFKPLYIKIMQALIKNTTIEGVASLFDQAEANRTRLIDGLAVYLAITEAQIEQNRLAIVAHGGTAPGVSGWIPTLGSAPARETNFDDVITTHGPF